MVVIEYRLIYSLAHNYEVFLYKNSGSSIPVPVEGSIININGNPFVIYEVSYAMGENDNATYVYVRVFKAGTFKLTIGGSSY